MNSLLSILLGMLILRFFGRVIYLWIQLWKHYRKMCEKYAVSIWKLPSTNLALMNVDDRKSTKRLYWKYALTLIIGMICIFLLGASLDTYLEAN
ncbi:MAG: hypothetical protein ACI865_000430 [Flavobacteriaceae bacterium]|jgi:hypothetical protein